MILNTRQIVPRLFHTIKHYWAILLVSIFTLLVKIPGLTWGFPGTMHNDESNLVRSSLGMRFGDLNPHHFDWPSFSFYFHYFIYWTFIKSRTVMQLLFGVEEMQELLPFWWGPELPFYYLTRLTSILVLSFTVFVVYLLALKISKGNKLIALVAGIIFSVGYWTNHTSFYGLPESLLVLFFVLSLFFALRILEHPSSISNYLWAGIFAGLATSTKYHGVLMCVVILCAHLLNNKKFTAIFDKKIIYAAIVSVAAFFAGTPYAALDWDTFMGTEDYTGAMWQISHMGKGLNWGYHLFETIPENFGWMIALFGFYGLYLSIKSSNKLMRLNAIAFAIILAYIGSWGITRAHYSVVLFPMFAIMSSLSVYELKSRLNLSTLKFTIILALLLFFPIYKTGEEIVRRSREDTRVVAGKWIENNLPKDSVIEANLAVTGIYGGQTPLFKYSDYISVFPHFKEYENRDNYRAKYIIFVTDEDIIPEKYQAYEVVYEISNELRTGPSFAIIYYDADTD